MSAFNYRSGSELLLPLFPKERVNLISSSASDRFNSKECSLGKFFSFHLSDSNKRYLTEKGFYLSPFSGEPHSHPVCKTIENYMIYVVLAGLLNDLDSCILASFKFSKFQNLKTRVKKECNLSVINRIIDAKDSVRYGNHDSYRSVLSAPDSFEAFGACPPNSNYFFFDEVHYWTPNSMLDFLEKNRPNVMMFTVVFPVEILFGYEFSANPNVYSFSISGDAVEFHPDGVASESYRQPIDMKWLFRSNQFVLSDQSSYSVTLYKTVAAHHFFIVSKVCSVIEHSRVFNDFDLLDLGNVLELNYRLAINGVRLSLFKRIVTYLTCLKNPDYQSAVAKMRQLCGDDVDMKEMMFFRDFAEKFASTGISSLSGDGLIKSFFVSIFDKFPNVLKRVSSRFTKDVLLHSIVEAKGVSFNFSLHKFYRGDEQSFYFRLLKAYGGEIEATNEGLLRPYAGGNWSNTVFHFITRREALEEAGCFAEYPKVPWSYSMYSANRKLVICTTDEVGLSFANLYSFTVRGDSISVRIFYAPVFLCNLFYGGKKYIVFFEAYAPICDVNRETDSPVLQSKSSLEDEIDSLYGDSFSLYESEGGAVGSEVNEGKRENEDVQKSNDDDGVSTMFRKARGSFRSQPIFEEVDVTQADFINEFLSKLNFERADNLKKRKALFFSDEFFYGHDSVKYTTYSMPSELKKIISDNNLNVNSVLVQKFEPNGAIPMHADDEACYDPEIPVFCINSGSATLFWCSKKDRVKINKFEMQGVCLYTMPERFQMNNLHSVQSSGSGFRYSLTFRLQSRQVYSGTIKDCSVLFSVPEESAETIERKNSCFVQAASISCNRSMGTLIAGIGLWDEDVHSKVVNDEGLSWNECDVICRTLSLRFKVVDKDKKIVRYLGADSCKHMTKTLVLEGDHFESLDEVGFMPGENKSVSSSSNRRLADLKELSNVSGISKVSHVVDVDGAAALNKSLLMGATGVCSDETFCGNADKAYNFEMKYKDVDLMTLYGFAGCGKSSPVQRVVDDVNFGKVLIVSPRKNLLNDWMLKCKSNKHLICRTFELALRINIRKFKLIVLDECSLFPKGYLDLLLIKMYREKSEAKLLLIGDPLQAEYFCKGDDLILQKGASNLPFEKNTKYLGYSHRCGSWLDKAVSGVSVQAMKNARDGLENKDDPVRVVNSVSSSDVVLVASFALKEYFKNVMMVSNVLTYGESQGLTFDDVTVVLSRESRSVDDGRIMVAFTRSRKTPRVYFHETDLSVFRGLSSSKVLRAFLFCETITINSLIDMDIQLKEANIGRKGDKERVKARKKIVEATLKTVESRTVGDPWLKAMLPLFEFVDGTNELPDEVDVVEPKAKCHVPLAPTDFAYIAASQSDPLGLRKDILSPLSCQSKMENMVRRASEDRESVATGVKTFQFDRMNVGGRTYMMNQADGFEAIYPTHSNDDTATFMMAVRKRLRFSNPISEAMELEDNWSKSFILYNNLKEKFLSNLDNRFSKDMFDECEKEFVEKKMAKNVATISAHAERSDPDWDTDFARIFMKSQHCTKLDNAMIDAKAGQTLACFSHAVLVKFGVWCRYIEKKLIECLPEKVYLHSRKNFNVFDTWVKKHKLDDNVVCVESDYSAFDRSQDAVSLGIEIMLMEDLGLPVNVIEDYKSMKLSLGSKLGNFAIMRFTGEFSTFLFNTISNMAFTAKMYKNVEDYPICFAGDDMCCLGDMEVDAGSALWMNDLRLTAKVFRSNIPTFCGWCLSKDGIFKHPELLLFRMRCAVEKGKVLECLDSYALEFSYAYSLSDELYRLLDENCLSAHQETTMLFMRYRHKMHQSTRTTLGWVNGKKGK